jgi:hypothetical protein
MSPALNFDRTCRIHSVPDGLVPKGSATGSFGKKTGPGLTQSLWIMLEVA